MTHQPAAPALARDELRALGLALVLSLVVWQLPYGGLIFYPFKLLATWMHELSHALVMLLTGAGFDHMEVYRDGSGLAYARWRVDGPARALIAAAGYMGTPLFGAALLTVSRRPAGARKALAVVGTLLVLSALVIEGEFGQVAIIGTGVVAVIASLVLRDRGAALLANFVAAQACINAVVDIRVLYRPILVVDGKTMGRSDAHTMALTTFGTDDSWALWFWASAWLLWSLLLFGVALVLVRRGEPAPPSPAASGEIAAG